MTVTLAAVTTACAPSTLANLNAKQSETEIFASQRLVQIERLAQIESRIGGRLGVALVDNAGNLIISHRGDERFAMCSTFKAPLASALFKAHEDGRVDMDAEFALSKNDLVPYAPYVEAQLSSGEKVSLRTLSKAAVQISDNAAANLVLKAIGGPEGFTEFVRANGDNITRLDRIEPELNENAVGDPRDTTSPKAIAQLMRTLLIAEAESNPDVRTLQGWMEGSTTGAKRIRAGLPKAWPVGDKTGTAPAGLAYNDIAIIWPSGNSEYRADPVILAVYTDRPTAKADEVNTAIADVARMVTKIVGLPD